MANEKISQLASGNPAQSGDLLPIARSGSNFSVTAASVSSLVNSVVQSGLLAEYRLTEGTGTTITDSSGNGNTGTFGAGGNAPTWVAGSGGLSFSGGQFVTLPSAVNAAKTIQIFCNYQQLATQTYQALILGNGTANQSQCGILLAGHTATAGDGSTGGANKLCSFGAGGSFPVSVRGGFQGVGLITLTLDTLSHFFVNNSEVPSYYTQGVGNINGTGVYQLGGCTTGAGAGATTFLTGTIYYAVFYNRALTAAEVAQNSAAIQIALANRGVTPTTKSTSSTDLLVADGDSITVGQGAVPYSQFVTLAGTWNVTNMAKTALTVPNLISGAPISADSAFPTNAQGVCAIWGGTNDIAASVSAQTVLNNLSAYCRQRRAIGWKTVVVTMLSRTGQDTGKNALNALIRRNWNMFADGLADVAANANLGADGASANTTYFQDGIHPTNFAQRNIVTPVLQKAINVLQGNLDLSSATTYSSGAAAATAITAASESGNTCTITSTLNPPVGRMVTIAGVTPSGYNGTFFVLTTSATNFTVYNSATGLGAGTVFGTAAIPLQVDGDVAVILGGSGAGNNFTLQSAVGYTGQTVTLKNTNSNSWTVTPFGSETIGGAANVTVAAGATLILESVLVSAAAGGANWVVVQNS